MEKQEKRHMGQNLQRIRVYLGVKQDTLASDLKMSQQSVSRRRCGAFFDDRAPPAARCPVAGASALSALSLAYLSKAPAFLHYFALKGRAAAAFPLKFRLCTCP